MNIELGSNVRDVITGFSGFVTGRAEYISGCSQCLVAPPSRDGDFKEPQWFDVQRLSKQPDYGVIKLVNSETPGADRPAPKR